LLLPCLGALLLGLLAHALDGTPEHAFAQVADGGLFSVVFPIGCLIVGDAMVGAEVRAGTLSFTWLSPVRLPVIVVGRWLTGTLIAAVAIGGSCALAAVVAGAPESAPPMLLATAAGSAAYVALFVLIGSTTRRAAVWSLAVVFLVERLLGSALAGIAQLSPTWESRAVFAGLAPDAESLYRSGIPEGWSAVVRLGLIAVVCLALASWRLGRLRLSGATD
jgi:ABC-type transport system involved in multi-copper enzyme maturation permease subunit